jgi:hypothetical protein
MPLAFDAAILSRMHEGTRPFPRAEQNPKENQDLGACGAEHSERENTERNAKLHENDAKRPAKSVHSVRGPFVDTGPPQKETAPGPSTPSAAADEGPWRSIRREDSAVPAIKQTDFGGGRR